MRAAPCTTSRPRRTEADPDPVLSAANPRLIYVKISSQGATGPERDYGSLGSTLEQTAGLA